MTNKYVKVVRVVTVTLMIGIIFLPVTFTAAEEIPRGGTFTVVLLSEPPRLDPYSGWWNIGFVTAQLFSKLLTFDDDMNLIPDLAKEMPEIDETEGTYTFRLRENVKWHDGTPFTAEDVKFSFDHTITKFASFGMMYFENVTATIIDDYTVKIKPAEFLPGVQMKLLGGQDCSIVPKHLVEPVLDEFIESAFVLENPVGCGPFKFKEWERGSYIVFERFEDYWDQPTPYLDEIVIKILTDPATIVAAFLKGEVDYIFRGMPYENYDTLVADPDLEVHLHPRPNYKSVVFINTKEVAKPIRQAWSYAINREEIVSRATNGLTKVTDSFWTPDIAPPSPDRTIYTYNPDKAKDILENAGYPADASGDRGISIELLMRRGEPEETLTAELMRDDLAAVGITLELKPIDFATWMELVYGYTFETALLKRWVQDFWGAQLFMSRWIQPGLAWSNSYQYDNPVVDTAFESWMTAVSKEDQIKHLQKVDEELTRDLPEIPLYDVTWLNVIRKTFQPVPGAKSGILPDGRWVFSDSLEYTYWTEGTVPVPFGPTKWLWLGTILVTTTTTFVVIKRRKKAN